MERPPSLREHMGAHVKPRGIGGSRPDAAEAEECLDRERRRQNARQPSQPTDSSLEQAQDLNRVAVSAAAERRAAISANAAHAGGIYITHLPLLLLPH